MSKVSIPADSIRAISVAANADVSVHGGKTRFIRTLSAFTTLSEMRCGQELNNALRDKEVGTRFADAVNALVGALKDGSFVPAGSGLALNVEDLPGDPEDDLSDEQVLKAAKKSFAMMNS
jgi:hypothetical protein